MKSLNAEYDNLLINTGEADVVDLPMIDFVKIHSNTETYCNVAKPTKNGLFNEYLASQNWQGKGIAKALYVVSGCWMQSSGFHLRSGQANDQAQRVWSSLEKDDIVHRKKLKFNSGISKERWLPYLDIPKRYVPSWREAKKQSVYR